MLRTIKWLVAISLTIPAIAGAGEWSGYFAFDSRSFLSDPAYDGQGDGDFSLAFEPEYYREWRNGRDSFTFAPFLRYDSRDSERSHLDVRELYWQRVGRSWELRAGISQVFWGVTESQHLVDVVNQTDLVESPDGEDKLGQPMLRLATFRSWGTLELFVLPGFRERTYPGRDGRLRSALPVDTDRARYESAAEDGHIDAAIRWSHVVGPFDLGLSYFRGTGRDPLLLLDDTGSEPTLVPFYEQIGQAGLDVQATTGGWLWKLEAIHRSGLHEDFVAATGGFEYTFGSPFARVTPKGGIWNNVDVGFLLEYLWDDRGEGAQTPFEDDVFVGTRWALNDTQSTEILAGAIVDTDSQASFLLLEASRRLLDTWKLELELRAFTGVPPDDPTAAIRSDDFLLLRLARHF